MKIKVGYKSGVATIIRLSKLACAVSTWQQLVAIIAGHYLHSERKILTKKSRVILIFLVGQVQNLWLVIVSFVKGRFYATMPNDATFWMAIKRRSRLAWFTSGYKDADYWFRHDLLPRTHLHWCQFEPPNEESCASGNCQTKVHVNDWTLRVALAEENKDRKLVTIVF